MSQYTVVVKWERNGAAFTDNRYSRGHYWNFDGGIEVRASASPHVVPLPLSVPEAVDPEEAFVAALASCHMLWFLSVAAKQGFVVESYRDQATGVLAKNAENKLAMTRVTLRPRVMFSHEKQPSADQHEAMHHEAHEQCFIAGSVKTVVGARQSLLRLIRSIPQQGRAPSLRRMRRLSWLRRQTALPL